MKKSLLLVAQILLIVGLQAQEITIDEILDRHYKATGYENLQKISTIIMTGTMIQNDAMPVKIIRMRPDRYLMEYDVADITSYQGYDGQTAWMTTPWTGNPKAQIMPDDRAKDMRIKADFDGVLINWKAKGHAVELAGRDTVDQSMAYKLKITKKEGGVEFLCLDMSTFLLSKRAYNRTIRGNEVLMEINFRDYRLVHGVMFSYTQDTFVGGQPYNSLQLESIETDLPVEGKIFTMPGGE